MTALLPDCPTCGGDWEATWDQSDDCQFAQYGYPEDCPDCDHGKVTVAQMAATWQAVWEPWELDAPERALLTYLRSVRPPSPKEAT